MSKIAEKIHNVAAQKAEEYSKTHGHSIIEEVAYGRGYKTAYIECYEQAFKDFLEKARTWFFSDLYKYLVNSKEISIDEISRHFKNYMQNEM